MKNRNTIEDEIDAIRIGLYEETKNMSSSEITLYISNKVKPICDKYGINPIDKPLERKILTKLDDTSI
jgi:hypothetical protein